MYYACMKRFFNNCPHVWSGRRCKTSQILYVFLTREMLVHLVNFEKCHSPIHSWPTQTGTVSTGKRWITTLIKKLWEISWNMWEQRNGEVNNPESPASLREHARLDALITTNYEDVSTLTIKDRRWFCCLKEVLFAKSLEYKHQWLESVCLARIQYARRRRTSTQAQRTLMRQTFCRRSTREPQPTIHPRNI